MDPPPKKRNSQQYGGEGIERDEQRRDNFQFGGKDELNLKPTVLFTAVSFFFRNLELLNPGINLLKIFGILNGWRFGSATQEFERFSCLLSAVCVREE